MNFLGNVNMIVYKIAAGDWTGLDALGGQKSPGHEDSSSMEALFFRDALDHKTTAYDFLKEGTERKVDGLKAFCEHQSPEMTTNLLRK